MGVIRGALLVIVSVLLLLSFILGNLLLTLNSSLNYENLQKEATSTIKDTLQEKFDFAGEIEKQKPLIELYCKTNTEYVFSYEDFTISIPCTIVSQGTNAILDEVLRDTIHSIYYKDYECDFLDCFKKSEIPLFLVSEKSYNFLNSKFYLLLVVSLALLAAMFFLTEKKSNTFILSGSLLIVSSLLFIKLDSLFFFISDKTILNLLGIVFSKAYFIGLSGLIAGAVLIVLGIVLKIFKVGFFLGNIFSKFKKKEVSKVKEQKQVKLKEKPIEKSKKGKKK